MKDEKEIRLYRVIGEIIQEHIDANGLTRSEVAVHLWPRNDDPERKLARVLREGQRITIYDAYRIAELLREPLSHLVTDVEIRMRSLKS